MTDLSLLAIGLAAGVLAGMFGIGGGLVIVPALLFVMNLGEKQAIATSLAALIPPVGLLGAIRYYQEGYVDLRYAMLIAAGLFLGAYFGAALTISLPSILIRRIYAVVLFGMGARMLFTK